MEKVINFFKKNKTTIISVLSAILTFVIALSQIDMGAKVGIVISILIVIIPFLISLINNNDMETTIKLLVNAITVIQKIMKDNQIDKKDVVVGVDANKKEVIELTKEEIRELITKGI